MMPRRATPGRKWTAEEQDYVVDCYALGVDDGTIGDAIARSATAIASFRRDHGLIAERVDTRQWHKTVEREWGNLYPSEIAALIGISGHAVSRIARKLGLGTHGLQPRTSAAAFVHPTPPPPKGYTAAQLLWAKAYAGDRQADLITSHHTGKRVGLGYGPRT
jgi:hypothetical protein